LQPDANLSFRYPQPSSQFTSRDVRALQDPADHRTTSHDLIVAVTRARGSSKYHQWEAVLLLEAAAREEGAGHDYLVQHSAGSGKSNIIAWLAHRLSALHDAADEAVFDKVVVITDRRVLDKQLQDTIYQVVIASRLHAVRYHQALTSYCREHGYDIGVLVAFSGTVTEGEGPDAQAWTEANMNGFPDSQTAQQFGEDRYPILVVAEKYQTGFDQPLLYAMYVDKGLTGLAAVQTLSRLNRPCDGKDGTFVLDFRNEADDVKRSFAPWYAATVSPPTDPNQMYDTRHALDPFGVLRPDEVQRAVALLVTVDDRFTRTYAFLSQVVSFIDVELERDYLFCKALSAFIRPAGAAALDLGSEVELTHLRTEQTFAGSVALDPLNEWFGTAWQDTDFVSFYGGVADKVVAQAEIQQAAAVNTPENFRLVLARAFEQQVVDQMSVAQEMALKFMDDPGLRDEIISVSLPFIQGRAMAARQEYCPIGELLGPDMESMHLEYKPSLRTLVSGQVSKTRETQILRTIAAFSNSRDGGTLLIGVTDSGVPCGLAGDYTSLHRHGKNDRDVFQLHLINIVVSAMGAAAAANVSAQFHSIDGADVCRVHVQPSALPVEAKVSTEKNGQLSKKTAFYVRIGNSTHELSMTEKAKYLLNRWPATSHKV